MDYRGLAHHSTFDLRELELELREPALEQIPPRSDTQNGLLGCRCGVGFVHVGPPSHLLTLSALLENSVNAHLPIL